MSPAHPQRSGRTVASLTRRPWNLGPLASAVGAPEVVHINRALNAQRRHRKAA